MSEDKRLNSLIASVEKGLGRPLTAEELEHLREHRQKIDQLTAEFAADMKARTKNWMPIAELILKLKSRQGTTMPDFSELYRRKAELDGENQ